MTLENGWNTQILPRSAFETKEQAIRYYKQKIGVLEAAMRELEKMILERDKADKIDADKKDTSTP